MGEEIYVHGVVHYCVANMPGACVRSATMALNNATLTYALKLANKGYKVVLKEEIGFMEGLYKRKVTNSSVAQDLGYEFVSPEKLI